MIASALALNPAGVLPFVEKRAAYAVLKSQGALGMSMSSSSLDAIGVFPCASEWTTTTKKTYEVIALRLRRVSMFEPWPTCGHRKLRDICQGLEACCWYCHLALTVNVNPSKLSAQLWSATSAHIKPIVERSEVCMPSGHVVMSGHLLRLQSRRTHRQDSHWRCDLKIVGLGNHAI